MSFNKRTNISFNIDDIEILEGDLLKTAALKLPEGFTYDPDYLYLKVKAVSAGEYWGSNKNDDYFPEIELINNYKTFLSAHTFKNHDNKKIESAIGDVLDAEWNDKMKSIYLIIRIDKRIAPSVVRGFEKGFMSDVSMGCRVNHVICSYCGKKAKTSFDYCEHLKYSKGKIMENGKKVYEINIGPKFHDISAVLNGAERTAKAVNIMISGDKVSAELQNKTLSKTASLNSLNAIDYFSENKTNNSDIDLEITASLFKKDKKITPHDVDKFKRKIKDKVISNALSTLSKESLMNFDNISDKLKMNYVHFWDKEKCIEIGENLKNISDLNDISKERVFAQFLKVLDFSAIQISPLELHDIYCEVMNIDTIDFRKANINTNPNILKICDKINDTMHINKNIPTVIKAATNINNILDDSGFSNKLSANPVGKIKIIIAKTNPVNDGIAHEDIINNNIMDDVVSKLLFERSNHRKFLFPRLIQLSKSNPEPLNNSSYFSLPLLSRINITKENKLAIIPAILSSIINSVYQKDREKRASNGELEDGILKFAGYFGADDFAFEKKAKLSKVKSIMVGVPLTMSYSALQRSRMNNGEPISSFNRYIAENPTNAAFLYSMAAGPSIKKLNLTNKKILSGAKKITDTGKELIKKSSELFDDLNVESMMSDKGYSKQGIQIIKYASVLTGIEKQDLAEDLLLEKKLNFGDIDEYLKTATACFKIEFEKNASNFVKNLGESVLGDVVFDNSKNKSLAGAMPGYLADGLIMAGITKGLSKVVKNKKGES